MKEALFNLSVGDEVWVQIVEQTAPDAYIVSYQNDLVRVLNASQRPLKPKQKLRVRVQAIQPLQFQIVESAGKPKNSKQLFDVSV